MEPSRHHMGPPRDAATEASQREGRRDGGGVERRRSSGGYRGGEAEKRCVVEEIEGEGGT